MASSNERKAQKEAGLLLLREQDENDMSGDRKGLKAAERRRRRRNVLRALAEPRNRREKVQEPVFTTTKPSERPKPSEAPNGGLAVASNGEVACVPGEW